MPRSETLKGSNEAVNRLTREAIQEALIYLLGKKNFEDISITEIVEKAGVSRSAYYRNYNSKEEILDDFSVHIFDLVFSSLKNEDYVSNRREWFLFVFNQVKASSRIFKLLLKAKYLNLKAAFPKIDFSKYSEKEKYEIMAIESGIAAIIEQWVEDEFRLTPKDLADTCCETFSDISLLFRK